MDTLFDSAMNGANHCQNENENAEKAKNEQLKLQNDKKEERLRIFHSKQLHEIKKKLDIMLIREDRDKLAEACFDFLPTRTDLDLAGWGDEDIFSH